MLQLIIKGREYYDYSKQEFFNIQDQTLTLEHSLLSISKWESKWKKPFFKKEQKTQEESEDYVKCMTITKNVDPKVYSCLDQEDYNKISAYIEDPMTATWFAEKPGSKKGSSQTITAELIYFWMVSYNIPFECEKWHLNRLLTLIKVCEIKNTPSKKMSKRDIYSRNKTLNAARRKQYGTNG